MQILTGIATESDGLLYSLNHYYKNGVLDDRDTTDQQNITDNINNTVSTKISYTEPLKKIFTWSSLMDLRIIITRVIVLPISKTLMANMMRWLIH